MFSDHQTAYLRYLHAALTRPLDDWGGFYIPHSQNANFALRYQIAFAGYAVAALATLTPAYRRPYAAALRCTVERMLSYDTWRYWQHTPGVPAEDDAQHKASPDPLAWGNVQYAGHLSTLLGLYAKLSGDHHYAEPGFTLEDERGHRFTHTAHDVAATIHAQMRDNDFHGVPCEPGCVYLSCNNHSMSSNLLHDQLYATDYAAVNGEWVGWLRRNMLLGMFPTLKHGVFNVVYMSEMKRPLPVGFNFTDGWGVGLLAAFARELAAELYPRYRRAVKRTAPGLAYVPSGPMTERMEVSDRPINSAFGYVAARELGDAPTATALAAYAADRWGLNERDGQLAYWGAKRTLYTTALFALGSVPDAVGAGWSAAILAPYQPERFAQPTLDAVLLDGELGGPPDVTVSHADYDAEAGTLHLTLTSRRAARLSLCLTNVTHIGQIWRDGQPLAVRLAADTLDLGPAMGGETFDLTIGGLG